MPGDISNPRLWEGADLWVAPINTPLPTDFTAAMDSEVDSLWESVGLLSEDGATESRDEDSNDFFAWGGKLIRTQRSKHKRSIQATALEDNPVVWKLVNPGSGVPVTTTGVTERKVAVPKSQKYAFCLEVSDGGVKTRRLIPTGEVTEVGDVTLSDSDMQAYELTISIYPDSAGVLYHDYTNDAQAVETP